MHILSRTNCLYALNKLPPQSVDLVFGSPPYEDARLNDGRGALLRGEAWVAWMLEVFRASLQVSKGLVGFVVEGRTKNFSWSATPALLVADLRRAGISVRKPPIYCRSGIPGSGGPDWWRNDYEWIICATNGGRLPWSDPTACGHPPKYKPGGAPTYRRRDGVRVTGRPRIAPARANPGNVIRGVVGGGHLGSKLAHESEAPFPEWLAERFVRSFCPPGGIVLDPFAGSGTTLAVAKQWGRHSIGFDIRDSQIDLCKRRLEATECPQNLSQLTGANEIVLMTETSSESWQTALSSMAQTPAASSPAA